MTKIELAKEIRRLLRQSEAVGEIIPFQGNKSIQIVLKDGSIFNIVLAEVAKKINRIGLTND